MSINSIIRPANDDNKHNTLVRTATTKTIFIHKNFNANQPQKRMKTNLSYSNPQPAIHIRRREWKRHVVNEPSNATHFALLAGMHRQQ